MVLMENTVVRTEALFPEFENHPEYRGAVKTYTLKALGLAQPEDAEQAGYTCIRPYQQITPYSSLAALWVKNEDLPRLQEIAAAIARQRQQAGQEKADVAAQKRARRLQVLEDTLAGHFPDLDPDSVNLLISRLVEPPKAVVGEINPKNIRSILATGRWDMCVQAAVRSDPERFSQTRKSLLVRVRIPVAIAGTLQELPGVIGFNYGDAEFQAAVMKHRPVADFLQDLQQMVEAKKESLQIEASEWAIQREGDWANRAPDDQPAARVMATALTQVLSNPDAHGRDLSGKLDRALGKALLNEMAPALEQQGIHYARNVLSANTVLHLQPDGQEKTVPAIIRLEAEPLLQQVVRTPLGAFSSNVQAAVADKARESAQRLERMAADETQRQLRKRSGQPARPAGRSAGEQAVITAEVDVGEVVWTAILNKLEQMARQHHPLVEFFISGDLPTEVRNRINAALLKADVTATRQVLDATLNRNPDYIQQFSRARNMWRRIIAYIGPTNSGKTWNALNRLAAAKNGVYLGPLRLLALEGQEELQKRGCNASLITGEERDIHPDATHLSATVEMADMRTEVECAVIDEIQMLGDPERGNAWVQALVGMPAREIVVTGSPNILPLLKVLAEKMDEPLEVHMLERRAPLHMMEHATPFNKVKPGSAIIAFSRAEVIRLQAQLPKHLTSAVIYGNLGPAVRRAEAERFRSGEAQILVATDAIAFGLNLPIKTVLFSTAEKHIRGKTIALEPSLIQQIAGRAGRYGLHEQGYVGALDQGTLKMIRRGMDKPAAAVPGPLTVRPRLENLMDIHESLPQINQLSRLLELYQQHVRFDSDLFIGADLSAMITLALVADRYENLTLKEKFSLASAPVDADNETIYRAFSEYAAAVGQGMQARVPTLGKRYRTGSTDDSETLYQAEILMKVMDLYCWLSYHFPAAFDQVDRVRSTQAELNRFIASSLKKKIVRRCRNCNTILPPHHVFPTCEACYRSRWQGEDYAYS
jgi:hypothetical protein